MPESPQTDANQQKVNKKKKHVLDPGMKRIFIFGVALLLVLLIFTFAQSSGRITFFTQNFLSLLVLVAIAIQAYIYAGQWEVMRRQWMAMRRGLIHTRAQVKQSEEATRVANKGIELSEKVAIYSQRAYLSAKLEGRSGSGYLFHLRIQNSGNTPANNVTVSYAFDFTKQPPDGLDVDFPNHVRLGVIAAHGDEVIDVPYTEEITPIRYHMEFQMRKLNFYIWGLIRYETIFQEKGGRRSRFCFHQKWEHDRGTPGEIGNEVD